MKKEEIVTLIIIGIIFVIDLITLSYTKKCIGKISDYLTNLETATIKNVNEKNENSEIKNESEKSNSKVSEEKNENKEAKSNEIEGENESEKTKSKKDEYVDNNKKEAESLKKTAEDIYNEWLVMNNTLTYYMEHDELEKVNVQLERIIANYEVNSMDDVAPDIKEAIYLLRHIEKKQRLTLRNIF